MTIELGTSDPRAILEPLFDKARDTDEFEYCCALLRIRGVQGPGWDPLRESMTLTQQLLALTQAPLEPGFRLRLSLFLYCHVTEIDDLYCLVANMLRVVRGERYVLYPFQGLPSSKYPTGYSLNARLDNLVTLAHQAGFPDVGRLFSLFFVRPVRNAFYHSDYILTGTSFNIAYGEGVNVGTLITQTVDLQWLVPRLELGINTALALLDLLIQSIGSYRENKLVKGRLGPGDSYITTQLTADEQFGLTGFQSPPQAQS
jgi:hypothetical protein